MKGGEKTEDKMTPGRVCDVIAAHTVCVCPSTSPQVPGTCQSLPLPSALGLGVLGFCLVLVCVKSYMTSYQFHLQCRGLGHSHSLVIYIVPNHRPVGKPLPALPYFQLYLIDPIYPIPSLLSCLSTFLTFFKSIHLLCANSPSPHRILVMET